MKVKKLLTIGFPVVLATTAIAGASVTLVSCAEPSKDAGETVTKFALNAANAEKMVNAITAAAGEAANDTKEKLVAAIKDGLNATTVMGDIVEKVDVVFSAELNTIPKEQTATIKDVVITLKANHAFEGETVADWTVSQSDTKVATYTPATAIETKIAGTKAEESTSVSVDLTADNNAIALAFAGAIKTANGDAALGTQTADAIKEKLEAAKTALAEALNAKLTADNISAIATTEAENADTIVFTLTGVTLDVVSSGIQVGEKLGLAAGDATLTATANQITITGKLFTPTATVTTVELTKTGLTALQDGAKTEVANLALDVFNKVIENETALSTVKDDIVKVLANGITKDQLGTISATWTAGTDGKITIAPATNVKFTMKKTEVAPTNCQIDESGNIVVSELQFTGPTATNPDILNNTFFDDKKSFVGTAENPSTNANSAKLTLDGAVSNTTATLKTGNASNTFVKISLKTLASNVFTSITGFGGSDAKIKWALKDGVQAGFALNNNILTNTEALNGDNKPVVLTATITINGVEVSTAIEVTLNLAAK